MTCQWVYKTHLHAFMFDLFNDFDGSRRFVNFQNFNSPVFGYAESDSILRDPLDTQDVFVTMNCVEMKWPLVDRAGIEQENCSRFHLKRRKS